jgi:hypothetical protein
MTAAVILFLATLAPGLPVRTLTQPMASLEACKAAEREWLAGEPDAHAIKEHPSTTRYALCVTLPTAGRDT